MTELHTEFPQEYWAADGVRQLVITTCGEYGRDSKGRWHYLKNIFVIATPVDPETGQPMPDPALEAEESGTADGQVASS